MKYIINQNRPVGFFSSFNIIVGALKHLHDNSKSNFYIHWKNSLYQKDNKNLFDKYFYEQDTIIEDGEHYEATDIGNIYDTTFNKELFLELNKILKLYKHFDNEIYKKCYDSCIKLDNCLGIHVRGTDHYQHGKLLDIEDYFKAIDNKMSKNKYNKILIITDEQEKINLFEQRYGNILHLNKNVQRSNNSTAIHFTGFNDLDKLVTDVMSDAISLSMCEEIIITSSNVAGYALMINPNIKFNQIDLHIDHL
jgi:hypothetical protein